MFLMLLVRRHGKGPQKLHGSRFDDTAEIRLMDPEVHALLCGAVW
jgi:hypothetical protein